MGIHMSFDLYEDRLILGHAWAFRLAVPLTASELRASEPELGQALAEIEDSESQSFRHLSAPALKSMEIQLEKRGDPRKRP